MSAFETIKKDLDCYAADLAKFEKGSAAAGVRARHALMRIKQSALEEKCRLMAVTKERRLKK